MRCNGNALQRAAMATHFVRCSAFPFFSCVHGSQKKQRDRERQKNRQVDRQIDRQIVCVCVFVRCNELPSFPRDVRVRETDRQTDRQTKWSGGAERAVCMAVSVTVYVCVAMLSVSVAVAVAVAVSVCVSGIIPWVRDTEWIYGGGTNTSTHALTHIHAYVCGYISGHMLVHCSFMCDHIYVSKYVHIQSYVHIPHILTHNI